MTRRSAGLEIEALKQLQNGPRVYQSLFFRLTFFLASRHVCCSKGDSLGTVGLCLLRAPFLLSSGGEDFFSVIKVQCFLLLFHREQRTAGSRLAEISKLKRREERAKAGGKKTQPNHVGRKKSVLADGDSKGNSKAAS